MIAHIVQVFTAVGPPPVTLYPTVMTSPDGITWTQRYAPGNNYYGVTSNGTIAVAVNISTPQTSFDYSSDNGATWTLGFTPASNGYPLDITFGNSLFVVCGGDDNGAQIWTSSNGIAWTLRTNPFNASGANWYFNRISWDGTRFVAFGQDASTNPIAVYSTNGTAWSTSTVTGLNVNSYLSDLSTGGPLWLAMGTASAATQVYATSPTGVTLDPANPNGAGIIGGFG